MGLALRELSALTAQGPSADDSTVIYQQLVSSRRSALKMSSHRGLPTLVWEEVFLMSNVAGISPSWVKKTSSWASAVKRTFWV